MRGKLVVLAAGISVLGAGAYPIEGAGETAMASPSVDEALTSMDLEALTIAAEEGSSEARLILAERFLTGTAGAPLDMDLAREWVLRLGENVTPFQKARASFVLSYVRRIEAGHPWPQPAAKTRLMGRSPALEPPSASEVIAALSSPEITPVNIALGGSENLEATQSVFDFLSRRYDWLLQGAGAEVNPALLPNGQVIYELTLTAMRNTGLAEMLCSILNLRACLVFPFDPGVSLQSDTVPASRMADIRAAQLRRLARAVPPAPAAPREAAPAKASSSSRMPSPPKTPPGPLPSAEGVSMVSLLGLRDTLSGFSSPPSKEEPPLEEIVEAVLPGTDDVSSSRDERSSYSIVAAGDIVPADEILFSRTHTTVSSDVELVRPSETRAIASVALPETPTLASRDFTLTLEHGDWLISILRKAGLRDPETYLAAAPLSDLVDADDLVAGTRIDVSERDGRLQSYTLHLEGRAFRVERTADRRFASVPVEMGEIAVAESLPPQPVAGVDVSSLPAAIRVSSPSLEFPLPASEPSRLPRMEIVFDAPRETRVVAGAFLPRPPVFSLPDVREGGSRTSHSRTMASLSLPRPQAVSREAAIPSVAALEVSSAADIPPAPSSRSIVAAIGFPEPDSHRFNAGVDVPVFPQEEIASAAALFPSRETARSSVGIPELQKITITAVMDWVRPLSVTSDVSLPSRERVYANASMPLPERISRLLEIPFSRPARASMSVGWLRPSTAVASISMPAMESHIFSLKIPRPAPATAVATASVAPDTRPVMPPPPAVMPEALPAETPVVSQERQDEFGFKVPVLLAAHVEREAPKETVSPASSPEPVLHDEKKDPPPPSAMEIVNLRFGLTRSLREVLLEEEMDGQVDAVLASVEAALETYGGRMTNEARLTRVAGKVVALEIIQDTGARIGAFLSPGGGVSALYTPPSAEEPGPAVPRPAPKPSVRVASPVEGMPPRVVALAPDLPQRALPGKAGWKGSIETMGVGDTLMGALVRANISEEDRYRLVSNLSRRMNVDRVAAGQELKLFSKEGGSAVAIPSPSGLVLAWTEGDSSGVATLERDALAHGLVAPSRLRDIGKDSVPSEPKPADPVRVARVSDTMPPPPSVPAGPLGDAFNEQGVRISPLRSKDVELTGHVTRTVPVRPRTQVEPLEPAVSSRLIPLENRAPRGAAIPSTVMSRPSATPYFIEFSTVSSAEDAWLEVNRLRLSLPPSVLDGLDLYGEPVSSGARQYRVAASGNFSTSDLEGLCQVIRSRFGETCRLMNRMWADNPDR